MAELLLMLTELEYKYDLPRGILTAMSYVESRHRNVVNKNDGGSPSYGPLQGKAATLRSVHPGLSNQDLVKWEHSVKAAAVYFTMHYRKYGLKRALCRYNTGKPYDNCEYAGKVLNVFEASNGTFKN